ncbi:polyphosphate kinase 1 [Acidiferrobacter sp. SPIII_3]|uniref:polyphosphate kinase 1 n=1 Tax=Acidiferrobacter sp. SPIII_3 TaxID=1281578 RepID=UPI000D738F2A|nr:polyphosphate kinase 1 [Acidiferrobacter sp. SPIII_3]AWP23648.1 polyphosphate kinase 1 [Acidiferrobacter sp. SPIII_3]
MTDIDLKNPSLYINRELSVLAFNRRVLEQAKDDRLPLLERLRFLCISSTNLDEFFEVRVAGLQQRAKIVGTALAPDDKTATETLRAVREETLDLVSEQYRVLNEILIPELAAARIHIIKRDSWTEAQDAWLRRHFEEELLPILSPLGLDPAHPFPRILNKSLNFIVSLEGRDAFGRHGGMAIVQAPRALARVIALPRTDHQSHEFVLLSSVIHAYVDRLFPGMAVLGCYQFRVTRNSDLFIDDDEIDDILRAVQGEIASRRYGDAVRLEVSRECPDATSGFLLRQFELEAEDLYAVNGPVNLNRLGEIYDRIERPDLKYPGFVPGVPRTLASGADLFAAIRHADLLVHHPFESFLPVVDFIQQAAADPLVLAIKQTMYRSGPDSLIADALVAAAQAGKEVTVVIELRARFDEAANIALANKLQEAGAHVLYGIVGFKTHAKMALIVRREAGVLRRYVHLGTGNYHLRTAKAYTDYGYFTCRPEIGKDVNQVFLQLTSLGSIMPLHRLIQSPFTLHTQMLALIDRERAHALAGRRARIMLKVNALTEPEIIQALYRASIDGVRIQLIVRGICCLRPGVAGVSDNIQVRSVIGRFLEHSRIYYFANGNQPEVYLASADWMERNFFRRVEVAFPIQSPRLRDRLVRDLKRYLKDNTHAWILQVDGQYRRSRPYKGNARDVQAELLAEFAEQG